MASKGLDENQWNQNTSCIGEIQKENETKKRFECLTEIDDLHQIKKKYALTPNCHGQPSVSLGRQCSAGNGFL